MTIIPEAITQDLKNGLTLEDTLTKHGTNLKELFKTNKRTPCRFNDWTYIRYTKHNTCRIVKCIPRLGYDVQFGTYKNHEDALKVRNELIKCGWDKKQLPSIYQKTGVAPTR